MTSQTPPADEIEPDASPTAQASDPMPSGNNPRPSAPWLTMVVLLLLCSVATVIFKEYAKGDLWSDEADYALASTRGFEANRWDRSDSAKEPERLIRGRHYHAPLTVDMISVAHHFGSSDVTIRFPFILAGSLSIGMIYLCGLSLFRDRHEIAIGCAALCTFTLPIIRMASHALPWSFIILELLILLWTLLRFGLTGHYAWIIAAGGILGFLFVTSEVFFVAIPAVAIALPFLLWPGIREREKRKQWIWGVLGGLALILAVALIIWPNGLRGGSLTMLRHYIQMRHSESFPVNIGSGVYTVAPKWAYLYWYWNDYRPFFVCYALGLPAVIVLALLRKLTTGVAPLLSLTGFLLFAAHRAHIIGPEYLAHCLPFLTLIGGYFISAIGHPHRALGFAALALLTVPIVRWKPRVPLPGMDARAQVSRWPGAARFLAGRWRKGDRIIVGSQPVSVARWYLVYQCSLPPLDSQFQTMPVHEPKPEFLGRLSSGFYRFAGVSSMVEDNVDLDVKTRRILSAWPVVWKSEENGTGPSRLTLYESPGVDPKSKPPSDRKTGGKVQ